MTSTASFKSKLKQAFSFFKWELKSCSGTLAIYAILSSVFMIIILTLCLVIGSYAQNETYKAYSVVNSAAITTPFEISQQVFQVISSYMIYFMTIIFTIIYTIKVFSYLHNKRQADLYGSLPVSRITLFFSKAASAFLFSLVPAMFFMGIMSIISICMGQPIVEEATQIYVRMIMGTIACISAYGLISVCCGTTLNSVIMFIAVCIAYPLSAMFIKGVIGAFFIGSYSVLTFDSFIMNALNPLDAYEGTNIIYWIIFTIVCLAASAFLVRKRKAERAQSSFAYYLPCHIVKVLVSFLIGMFLGVLFGSLNVFGYGYLGFVFGFILGSVPAFIISHLIFYKGFSKLIKTSIPLAGLIVAVAVGMAVCNFDLIGYNSFVPEADEITSAGFISSEECFYEPETDLNRMIKESVSDFDQKEDIELIANAHNTYLNQTDWASNKKFAYVWIDIFEENLSLDSYSDWYSFTYKMNSGRTVTRVYSDTIFDYFYDEAIDMEEMLSSTYSYSYNKPTDFEIAVEKITGKKQYVQKYGSMCNTDVKYVDGFTVYGSTKDGVTHSATIVSDYENVSENTQAAADTKRIIEAFKKDFKADTKNTDMVLYYFNNIEDNNYEISDDYYYEFDYIKEKYPDAVCELNINTYAMEDFSSLSDIFSKSRGSGYQSESFVIPKSYTNTIAALKEANVLNSDLTISASSIYYDYYNDYYDYS